MRIKKDDSHVTKNIYNVPFVRGYYMIGVSRYWFLQIASVLSSLGKEDIILPLLEEITELIWETAMKNAVSEGTVISEDIMYEWYDMILFFANRAYHNSKVIDKEQFLKIEKKYKPKMYELTGRDFSIIYPNEN